LNFSVLAFDFGEKRIGVAVGNTLLRKAQPLKTILNKGADSTFAQIAELIKDWEATLCVVGLPRHPDGNAHEMTKKATRFGNQLHGRCSIPVVWVDERYSSAVVEDASSDIDAQAAMIILEQYFAENP
jgi:putative Holliday junction resolvase